MKKVFNYSFKQWKMLFTNPYTIAIIIIINFYSIITIHNLNILLNSNDIFLHGSLKYFLNYFSSWRFITFGIFIPYTFIIIYLDNLLTPTINIYLRLGGRTKITSLPLFYLSFFPKDKYFYVFLKNPSNNLQDSYLSLLIEASYFLKDFPLLVLIHSIFVLLSLVSIYFLYDLLQNFIKSKVLSFIVILIYILLFLTSKTFPYKLFQRIVPFTLQGHILIQYKLNNPYFIPYLNTFVFWSSLIIGTMILLYWKEHYRNL